MGLHTGARQLTPKEWTELSAAVFERDGWTCLAPRLDPDAGPCRDRHGDVFDADAISLTSWRPGRLIYVRRFLTLQHIQLAGRTEHDVQHLLTLCWGHHLGHGEKGGRIWSKQSAAAQLQRDHLLKLYPSVALSLSGVTPR